MKLKFRDASGKLNWGNILGVILFVTLVLSIVYTLVCMANAPEHAINNEKAKGDYLLMLVQCTLGLVVMLLPSIIQKKWHIGIPNYMYVLYFVFLYCAIYLGEVRNFYFVVPHWDTILHIFSGAMLGALGFTLVTLFNDEKKIPIQLSPFFVAFFAFCFALAAGAVWEIYEYTMDGIMKLNMQKYALEDGTLLIGRAALLDTMKDLIVDALGALALTVFGYWNLKNQIKRQRASEQNG